jgi:hypothetical protein
MIRAAIDVLYADTAEVDAPQQFGGGVSQQAAGAFLGRSDSVVAAAGCGGLVAGRVPHGAPESNGHAQMVHRAAMTVMELMIGLSGCNRRAPVAGSQG